ncbi:ubiquitin-like modifier-activating enzyme 1 [Dermacentor andersoni]|uniref:ubiquitin-like modifier-activating enzyme 1 n=1 Tax=Dermacentor andersoni TaxID=34620 RepID=UPI002415DBE9|nr:ubiquitin-like modifier-activating enzyme 1 [Dermacentor andersoni]
MSRTLPPFTVEEEEDITPPAKKRRTDDSSGNDASDKANGLQAPANSSAQNPPEIDESLYSRQLYVLGRDAMLRMAQSDVLISGMGGLGVEIAKNVVLGGVKSVTIHDTAVCTRDDLSSQYYLSEENLGENRASASEPWLTRLNQYVCVNTYTKPLSPDFVQKFSVVVLTETPLEQQQLVSDFTHGNNISLIVADTRGLAGQIFCDFGENFRVLDTNGEQPLSILIDSITKGEEGVVTCLDRMRHGFEDGDYVTFSEVKGMTEINNCPPMKIKVLGPYTFSIGDTTQFGEYTLGGVATQVKMPKDIKFKSLRESMAEPDFVISDFAKVNRAPQLHLGFQALHEFHEFHSRLPRPWNKDDAAEVVQLAKKKNAAKATPLESVDEKLITTLSCVSAGSLCPMQAVIGSIAAQEVMKACSGKFMPIQQWLYFDAFECLPKGGDVLEAAANAMERTRYAAQTRVFGVGVQDQLMAQNYFVVGAGAIGCELLKNFAMMGIGASDGLIHVTDMDVIERSNLNRQFLFRPEDVGRMKSATAAKAVVEMNPDVNIAVHEDRVGPETENVYNDDFFDSLHGVANALDNVDARQYMDKRCVYYRKPLLESGTMGTKGNVQVVKPDLTESYSSSHDPPEKSVPVCTIKHFPNNIEHTLQWARDEFEGLFKQSAASAVQYLSDPHFRLKVLQTLPLNQKVVLMEEMKKILVDERAIVFDDCVAFARLRFQEQYSNQIRQLLRNFPENHTTTSGTLFWSGHKRCPHPIEFDPDNALHMDYIVAAANLRATMFGIPCITDRQAIAAMLKEVEVPAFNPQPNAHTAVNVNDANAQPVAQQVESPLNDEDRLVQLLEELPVPEKLQDVTLTTLEFEKDDDTNFHMDFIVAASNLRAANYDIEPADRLQSKLIAGKIIPAIATTTSLVAGLACLELYKLAQDHNELELYKNGFVNLALPFFGFSEPITPVKKKFRDLEFSLWTTLDIQGELTLQNFIDNFQNEYKVEIIILAEGVVMLYANFMPPPARRLKMTLSEVVEEVSKKKIDPGKRALMLQVMCADSDGNEIEAPMVRYLLPTQEQETVDPPV